MALATQCPHCHTTFRVAHDQLKLRAGLVRCGACKQIFNGIENLLHSEDPPVASSAPPPDSDRMDETKPEAAHAVPEPTQPTVSEEPPVPGAIEPEEESAEEPPTPEPEGPPTTESADSDDLWWQIESSAEEAPASPEQPAPEPADAAEFEFESIPQDPLLRMTLMDFSEREPAALAAAPAPAQGPDPIEQAMADLERMPLRGVKRSEHALDEQTEEAEIDDEFDEPGFMHQGRRRKRVRRALRLTMMVGSVLLLLAFLGQSAYVFRDQLAARYPQTKPLLLRACAALDCQLGLPAQIDAVSIESSELQTLAPNSNMFGLTVLMRNHSAIDQTWPHIELTLNDAGEKPLARRAFAPEEYLPSMAAVREGFGGQSERPVRLFFELDELKASGYRIYLFYP